MQKFKDFLARFLPRPIGVRWLNQPGFHGGFASFEDAIAEAERINGKPFKKDGPFLHDYRLPLK
ncbi:MAG: hypothetical protein J0H42_04115 [Rhizobiales bacterium]|nr:hypothetical protein [Hyphomicrobiales bacterium]